MAAASPWKANTGEAPSRACICPKSALWIWAAQAPSCGPLGPHDGAWAAQIHNALLGQMHARDGASPVFAFHGEAAAMQFHERLYDRQSKADSSVRTRIGAFRLTERLHDDREFVRGNALAVILYDHVHAIRGTLNAYLNQIAFACELHRVGNEIDDHLPKSHL